jgi:hypothetical protein
VALGSCLTAGIAAVAQQRKIQLRSVRASIEAAMDLHGILGADPDVRNGFSAGANTLNVDRGRVSLLTVLPKNGGAQSVPTSITRGPDGALDVGELGFGAGTGKAWLLDMTPGASAIQAALPFGSSWTDPSKKLTIKSVTKTTAGKAQVIVTLTA